MRRAPSLALAAVVVSVFLSPVQRELYVGDETKYSQVVREMRAGSFFLPTLNGTPFTHKPPLHFWIVDLLTHVFGVYSIWSFVLPSLAAFVLLLALMRRMGGAMAAFVCGTSLLMWGSAQTARMDVAFAALLALAAHFIWRAEGPLPFSAGVATGVAFLFKGPMAPVITLALFAFESIRRRRRPAAKDALAILPMLLIPLLWLVPALLIGGEPFWREIFYKQTVGRAVGAWVHKSPPWFYLVRAPLTLLPWFFLAVAALIGAYRRKDESARFAVSWILAVLVPYTLLSSKLDVYMIAMLPAVALLIARHLETEDPWGRLANLLMLGVFALAGAVGLLVQPRHMKEDDARVLITRLDVRMLFAVLLIGAIVAVVVTLRGRLVASTIATGLVPVLALSYAAVALVPLANEMASTRPLVRALESQGVPPEQMATYTAPHLWVRGMNPALESVRQIGSGREISAGWPRVLVTRRKDTPAIEEQLRGSVKTGQLRMIGKWFDVYRR